MSYANKTSVSVDRSQSEIRKILTKYSATGFGFAEQGARAIIMFEMCDRRIKFTLPLPILKECKNPKAYDQTCRSQWRCLTLAIKAKLQSVESGITTLEQEFLAHIVLPNGSTVGDVMIPQIEHAYSNKKMPPLLGYSV